MATNILSEIDGSELVGSDDLAALIEELVSADDGSLVLEGSLLDHMIDDYHQVLQFSRDDEEISFEFAIDWPDNFPSGEKAEERNRTRDACLRSGVASHPNLDQVMEVLRAQDDVVIGVDGDILKDCIMTSTLLKEIYAETYPNWILIGIPRLVMNEIERSAKETFSEGGHPRVGWPTYEGRIGQRGLQEVMDIREKNPDRPGLAMMTIGDLQRDWGEVEREEWKVDALIRDQFSEFLDDIGFHKGTFFLSENRVNVMMSGTEGSDALYLQKPEFEAIRQGSVPIDEFSDLVYELCLQFGSIRLRDSDGDRQVDFSIYWPGKKILDWEDGRVNVVSVV
jgi:hypothetical protein